MRPVASNQSLGLQVPTLHLPYDTHKLQLLGGPGYLQLAPQLPLQPTYQAVSQVEIGLEVELKPNYKYPGPASKSHGPPSRDRRLIWVLSFRSCLRLPFRGGHPRASSDEVILNSCYCHCWEYTKLGLNSGVGIFAICSEHLILSTREGLVCVNLLASWGVLLEASTPTPGRIQKLDPPILDSNTPMV